MMQCDQCRGDMPDGPEIQVVARAQRRDLISGRPMPRPRHLCTQYGFCSRQCLFLWDIANYAETETAALTRSTGFMDRLRRRPQ